MFLLDDILLAPVKAIVWMGKKFNELADEELTDGEALHRKLRELQLLYEMDEVSDEDYDRQEREILDRLEAISRKDEPTQKPAPTREPEDAMESPCGEVHERDEELELSPAP